MFKKVRANLLVFIDLILLCFSVYLAYYLKFEGQIGAIPEKFLNNIIYVAIISALFKVMCLAIFKLYRSLWEFAGIQELMGVVIVSIIGNSVMLAIDLIAQAVSGSLYAPRSIFVITFLIDIFFIGGVRISYRVMRRLSKGNKISNSSSKRVMIIGGGDAGAMIIREMKDNPHLQYIPVAVIDDDNRKHGNKLKGVPIVGGRSSIAPEIKNRKVDEIIIAIPSAEKIDINEIYAECTKTECKVKILPSVSQLINEAVILQRVRDVSIEDLLGRESIKMDNPEIVKFLKYKTILVTGGGGSIGSELCRQICQYEPRRLVILDNYENCLFEINNELLHKHPEIDIIPVVANIREPERIDSIVKMYLPNIIFHAAAHKHVPLMEENPSEAIKNNVFGTINVAKSAQRNRIEKFILISSDKAVNPTNIMGASKRIAELSIQSLNKEGKTEFVAVRFGNVLGSNGSVVPIFKKQIEQGGPVTVTHPDVIRYFMTIPEAVQLVLQAATMAKGGEIFVLDMGSPMKIIDLARNLIKLSGYEPDKDIKIEIVGLRPGEKLYEELLLGEEGIQKTENEKIYIAQPTEIDINKFKDEIEILKKAQSMTTEELIEHIQNIVPTYNRNGKK